MEVGNIVKIKNPSLAYQGALRYKVTKVNKTTIRCRVVEFNKDTNGYKDVHYGKDYANVKRSSVIVC